jgi:hypothetical protein
VKRGRLSTDAFQPAVEDGKYSDKLFSAIQACLDNFSDPLVRIIVEFAQTRNAWQTTSDCSKAGLVQTTATRCTVTELADRGCVRLFSVEKLYSGIHRLTVGCAPGVLIHHGPGVGIVFGDTLSVAANCITWKAAINAVWAETMTTVRTVAVCGPKSPELSPYADQVHCELDLDANVIRWRLSGDKTSSCTGTFHFHRQPDECVRFWVTLTEAGCYVIQ